MGEKGGVNLYNFLKNESVISIDLFGLCDTSKKWDCEITRSIVSSDETEEAIKQAIALQGITKGISSYGNMMVLSGVRNLGQLGVALAGLSTDEVDVLTSQALANTISSNSSMDDFRKVKIRITVSYSSYNSNCCVETKTEDSETGPYKNARVAESQVSKEERKAIKKICK
jgi:hypothetical protein